MELHRDLRPGDRVQIVALEGGSAIVIGVLMELGGTTYNARYWHNELRREAVSP